LPLAFTGLYRAIVPLLLTIAASWIVGALAFERAVRRTPIEWRPSFGRRLLTVCSPLTLLRALDGIARESVGDLDPMAVAAALLGPDALASFARPRLAEWIHADFGKAPHETQNILGDWQRRHRLWTETMLTAQSISVQSLMATPQKDGRDVGAYCPRCRAQYVSGHAQGDHCPEPECLQIKLQPF
jgi:hypothetical protein